MTKGELLMAIDSAPDEAEILLVIGDGEVAFDAVDISYTGFCDPTYTIRLVGKPPVNDPDVKCTSCGWRGKLSESNDGSEFAEDMPICPDCFAKEEVVPVSIATPTVGGDA